MSASPTGSKLTPITDPAEIEELTTGPADLSKPITYQSRGQLWADAEQMRAWRQARKLAPDNSVLAT